MQKSGSLSSFRGIQIDTRTLLFLFVFISSICTLHWIHFDLTPAKSGIVLLLISFALTFISDRFWPDNFVFHWPDKKLNSKNLIIAAFCLLPFFLYLFLSWRSEFPFGGDNSFHVFTATTYYRFLTRTVPSQFVNLTIIGLGVLIFFSLLCLVKKSVFIKLPRIIFIPSFLLLFASSFFISFAEEQMRTYPQMFYVLSLFFQSVANQFSWNEPYNAFRATNALAPLFWLLLFRPLILKRWPDRRALFFSIFFYWRWPLMYFGTGNYLESWAIIFILLGMEKYFDNQEETHWISLLLFGCSTLFKENALFFFPFGVLIIFILCNKKRVAAAVAGVICSSSFILYYFHRTLAETGRSFILDSWENITHSFRIEEAISRNQLFLGSTSIQLLLAIGLVLLVLSFFRRGYSRKLFLAALFTQFLFFIFFFYLDATSGGPLYIGYPRFQFYWLMLYGWILIECLQAINSKRLETVCMILFLILNGYGSYQFLSISHGDDFRRNTLENYDAAVFYPIRGLIRKISPMIPEYDSLIVASDRFPPYDLKRVYGIEKPVLSPGEPGAEAETCKCTDNKKLLLFLHEIPQNLLLNSSKSKLRQTSIEQLKQREGLLEQCLQKLNSSCKVVVSQLSNTGLPWGYAGWGTK